MDRKGIKDGEVRLQVIVERRLKPEQTIVKGIFLSTLKASQRYNEAVFHACREFLTQKELDVVVDAHGADPIEWRENAAYAISDVYLREHIQWTWQDAPLDLSGGELEALTQMAQHSQEKLLLEIRTIARR